MANVINQINLNGTTYNIATTAYAVCGTEATEVAKTAIIFDSNKESNFAGFTLVKGVTIHVQFVYTNEAVSPTLNVNNTGAKPIRNSSSAVPGVIPETSWYAGEIVTLTYDGANWRINKNRLKLEPLLARIAAAEQRMEELNIPPIVEVE